VDSAHPAVLHMAERSLSLDAHSSTDHADREECAPRQKQFGLDDETVIGPLVSSEHLDKVDRLVKTGVADGAELVTGGVRADGSLSSGYFYRPTVFGGVTDDMTIAREEIFGPVLSIIPFDTEEEAIEIANDTDYGLSGGVWAGTQEHAIEVAQKLRTGQVDVNGGDFNPLAPFGGYKKSGIGRERGAFGFEEFLEVKSIQR